MMHWKMKTKDMMCLLKDSLWYCALYVKILRKLKNYAKEYERDMPTEMKLIYDVHSSKFKAQYKYDLVYTNDEVKTASHIADEWFEEVKNNKL